MRLPSTRRYLRLISIALALSGTALTANAQEPDLKAVLDKAGQRVAAFLDKMSDVKCTEHVLQQKLSNSGHVEYAENTTYDYLLMLQANKDDLQLNESRLAEKGQEPKKKKNLSLLLTNGFSTLFLVFHPYYQDSYRFSSEGMEQAGNEQLMRVHFTHVPGTRTVAALAVRGREYPLDLQGTAWIEPQTGLITKIQAGLENNMQDVGLRSLTAQVDYSPVNLPGSKSTYLFPTVTTVDVQSLRQRWHNVHKFSGYMQFTVEAEQASADKEKIK